MLAIKLLFLAVVANAFSIRRLPTISRGLISYNSRCLQSSSLSMANPDLFSDDLFEDDEDGKSGKKDDKEMAELPSKRKYLEQKWKLNPDDEKEFKGFPDQKTAVKVRSENEPVPDYPCFAVVYKFRREYMDVSIDAMLADHRGHCQKFKRLVNSEVIKMNKAKGVVLLWTGLKEDDAKETKADIMAFLEEDPLIAKDAIEKWDIIPLSTKSKDLPADVAAV